jgi:hypothetical protein
MQAAAPRRPASPTSPFGGVGERPPGRFGGLPVSEIAIAVGLVSVVVGYLGGNPVAIATGAVICGLAVTEVTSREHFSGFRSHAALLAAIPAVILETLLVVLFGEPSNRLLLVVPMVPVFAAGFWWLRRRFETARHARVTKPPAP